MPDNEENWKNSEVISIFAEQYFANMVDNNLVEEVPKFSDIKVNDNHTTNELTQQLLVSAELEREIIIDDLRKLLASAINEKNHRAALLIEGAIEKIYLE